MQRAALRQLAAWQPATDALQHATDASQPATDALQHATDALQHATDCVARRFKPKRMRCQGRFDGL
jgi:hypothetical protein